MTDVLRHEKKIIASLFFLALLLRGLALSFGLPGLFHADEPIVLNHALAYASGDLNPHFFKIPPLVSYLLFGVFGIYYFLGHLAGVFANPSVFEQFFYAEPASFYILARVIFGAFAGSLTVVFFYRTIRQHFGALRAVAAAFFLAVCFLHVADSHYLYADIPLLLVLVIAVGFFWRLNSASGFGFHAIAGALIGIAAAVKYNGVFIGAVYGVMLIGWRGGYRAKTLFGAVAALSAAAVFCMLNPFAVMDRSFFIDELQAQSRAQNGVGWLHHGLYSLPGAVGWPMLAAALAGFGAVLGCPQTRDDRVKRCALLVFTAGYYAVLVYAGQPYPRYVLPLLPGILFFAADFLVFIAEAKKCKKILGIGIILLSLFPFSKSILWCRLMNAQDVRTEAKIWFEKNVPSGVPTALDWDFYMPRLNFTPKQLRIKKAEAQASESFGGSKIRKLQALIQRSSEEPSYELYFLVPKPQEQERFLLASPVLPYDLKAVQEQGVQFAAVLPGIRQPAAPQFYEDLARTSKLLHTFSPYRNGRLLPYDTVDMTGGPFTWNEILHRRCNGHTIQIYALKGRAAA
ncbi:MAG: glycosyltransferase family 39 protein [Candidatus Omnitrophica bacterium]|nr:glycosyltransferase family 39 protein [Candidatus Omnitrophota bacterium]